MEDYGLDLHGTMLLEEYRESMPVFEKMEGIVRSLLESSIRESGIYLNAIETRIKSEKSLAGKLELKGSKYATLSDITDIIGARVITFYSDEVDKISALIDRLFIIDWKNSVDKRKLLDLRSFGYMSLHYICRIPKSVYYDPQCPLINEYRFEVQMRTALQHVWATLDHDIGYKTGVEIPPEYLRSLNRLSGVLELVDEQFSSLRTSINEYRRKVNSLVENGRFDEVQLDGDTFRSYLKLGPFDKLNKKIAAINQAEIHESSVMAYLTVFKELGFKTLGDVKRLIKDYGEYAYQLAVYQIGVTDLDIISSSLAVQNLCITYILRNGGGVPELKRMFDLLGGESDYNRTRAERVHFEARQLSFMNKD